MPLVSALVGGGGPVQSRNLGADTLINLYYESNPLPGEAKQDGLYRTPGLALWGIAGDGPCRGLFAKDGRAFAAMGATLYELDLVNNAFTSRGALVNDGLPVFMDSNGQGGNQLAIAGGGGLSVLNLVTNTLSTVTLPLTNAPGSFWFWDGSFMLCEKNTLRTWYSAIEDGTSWSALNFFARSQSSDNVVGGMMLHDRFLLYGSQTSQIYWDDGDTLNPFQPYPSTLTQEGAISPYGMMIVGEAAFWLSQDNQGQRRMVMAQDYAPQRISTPAVDFDLAGYRSVNDVEVFAYEQNGHAMIRWTFPSGGDAGTAWEYDISESQKTGTPQWHKCQHWDSNLSRFDRPRPRGICTSDNGLIVGDYQNNCLYYLSQGAYTDNGDTIKWARRAPYFSAENQWLFVDEIEMGIESGVGTTGQGATPQIMLSLSRDSGHTWSAPIQAGQGGTGAFDARAVWRRLGRARADRLVVEITGTDPVKTVLGPGMWLRATPGTGQL